MATQEEILRLRVELVGDDATKALIELANRQNQAAEAARLMAIDQKRLASVSRDAANSFSNSARGIKAAANDFVTGAEGIKFWSTNLNNSRNALSSWVAAMGNVDTVNRKFQESLHGNVNGISNWVGALGKASAESKNLFTNTGGVSNWIKAMGQVGASVDAVDAALMQSKKNIDNWSTSLVGSATGTGAWVSRLGEVDAANRRFQASLLGSTDGVSNWMLALSRANTESRDLFTKTDGVSRWVQAMGQASAATEGVSTSLKNAKPALDAWNSTLANSANAFRIGADGIRSWTTSLDSGKTAVAGWVQSLSSVDAVNRKFQEGLHGNVNGISNWVAAMGKANAESRNLFTKIDGVSNWVKAMGQVGASVDMADAAFKRTKNTIDDWNTSLVSSANGVNSWVSRLGEVDAANRRFQASLLGSTDGVSNWMLALSRANTESRSLFAKTDGVSNWVKAMAQASTASEGVASSLRNAKPTIDAWNTSLANSASAFSAGAEGIRAWTTTLDSSRSAVTSWVQALSNVDAVNRKFQESLHGNVNGISNWVAAMGKANAESRNMFAKTEGVSNWVKAMGQVSATTTQTASTLRSAKSAIDEWNSSMLNSGKSTGDWISRMGEIDATNRKFNQSLLGNTNGISNWVLAMGQSTKASAATDNALDKVKNGAKNAASAFKGAGHTIRNISAQFADFAVQIGGGQNAMTAFAQQAPQLLAAFAGPTAAIAGAAVAIAAAWPALTALFGALTNTTRPLKDAMDQLNAAMDSIGNTGKKFKLDQFIEEFNNADKATRKSMISILEWQKEVAKLKAEQGVKSGQKSIQDDLTPSAWRKTLDALTSQFGSEKMSRSLDAFGDDFAGAQNTLVDGLKISKEAAQDLLVQLNFFSKLPESEMRRIILLFEKAGNTRFDETLKGLYQMRDAQINLRRSTEESNKTLKQAKDAFTSGKDIPTPNKSGGNEKQNLSFFDKWRNSILETTQASKLADEELAFLLNNFDQLAAAGGNTEAVINRLNEEIAKLAKQSSSESNFLIGFDAELNNAQIKAKQLQSQLESLRLVSSNINLTGQTGIFNPGSVTDQSINITADTTGLQVIDDKLAGVGEKISKINATPVKFSQEQVRKSAAVMDELMAKLKLTRTQAAGVVGNLFQESGLQNNITNSIGAFGLAQWLGDRKKELQRFAKDRGTIASDFNTQIQFIVHELQTSEKNALNKLRGTSTLDSAVSVFRKKYERPGEAEANDSRRLGAAKTALTATQGAAKEIAQTYSVSVDSTEAIKGIKTIKDQASGIGSVFAKQDQQIANTAALNQRIKLSAELEQLTGKTHDPTLEIIRDTGKLEQLPEFIERFNIKLNEMEARGEKGSPVFKAYTDQVIKWKQEWANATGVVAVPLEQLSQEAQKLDSIPPVITALEEHLNRLRDAGQENTAEFKLATDELVKFKTQMAAASNVAFVPFEQIAQESQRLSTIPSAIAQIEERLKAMKLAGKENTIEFRALTETGIKMGQEFDNALGNIHLPFGEIALEAKQLDQIPAAIEVINAKLKEMTEAGLQGSQAFRLLAEKRNELQAMTGALGALQAQLNQQAAELDIIPEKIALIQKNMQSNGGLIPDGMAQDQIIQLRQMAGEFDTTAARFNDLMDNQMSGAINTFTDALFGAKFSFRDFCNSMAKDIIKFVLQEQLTSWFKNLKADGDGLSKTLSNMGNSLSGLGSLFGSSGGSSNTFNGTGPLKSFGNSSGGGGTNYTGYAQMALQLFSMFAANGAAFNAGNVIPYATGGIVNRSTLFGMSGGRMGMMGEAGPEAILPLRRGANGALGVQVMPSNSANTAMNKTNTINHSITINQHFSGQADPNQVRKASSQGARQAMAAMNGAARYQ